MPEFAAQLVMYEQLPIAPLTVAQVYPAVAPAEIEPLAVDCDAGGVLVVVVGVVVVGVVVVVGSGVTCVTVNVVAVAVLAVKSSSFPIKTHPVQPNVAAPEDIAIGL